MNKLRKMFTIGVMMLTVIVMSGALVSPVKAVAQAGDLIKMDGLSAVYYLGDDGKRYVFPNEATYMSWYADFSGVVTVPASELQSYPIGGNVTMRPGTKLVKITTDPTVYAVEPGGSLRSIVSEANAIALFGANWASMVVDVPDSFFVNYTVNSPLTAGVYPAGTLVQMEGSSDVYYFDGSEYRMFSGEAAFLANNFKWSDVITTSMTITSSGTITGFEAELFNPSNGTPGTGPISTGTGLNVALSATTPAVANIPSDSTRVTFTEFNVTASNDGDIVLQEVTVKREGVGAYNDISKVFIYDGENRLNNGRTINSDTNTAEITGLDVTIAAGTTKTLSIVGNIGSSKSGNHSLGIESASAISAGGATVSGSFPVMGNVMSLVYGTSVGTITIAKVGTIGNPTIGDNAAEVTSFKLTAGTEDVLVRNITLKNEGDLTTSLLSNFSLMQGTTQIPAAFSVEGRYINIVLDTPFEIKNGVAKNFTLKADISSSAEVEKTIKLLVDNSADVYATSEQYGFGVAATITSFDTVTTDTHNLTTQGGSVTISNETSPASDVKTNSTEVELMKVAVTAADDSIEVQQMIMSLATTKVASSSSNTGDWGTYRDTNNDGDYDSGETLLIKNIKLKDADTGVTLGSSKAITDATGWVASNDVDATLTFTYDDYFSISRNSTRNIVVVADIDSNQISGVVYKATLKFDTSSFIVKDSQDNTVTDIVPAADIAGENRTTRTSSLTISRASTPETMTVVAGSEVDALGMIMATGSGTGNDVKLSGLTLNVYVDNGETSAGTFVDTTEGTVDANELVTEVNLYVNGSKIAGPVSVDSSGNAVFTSNKFVGGYYEIPAGTNVTVIAKAKTSGNAPYGSSDDSFAFTFAASDVTAEDAEGSVTATVTGININGTISPSVYTKLTSAGTITIAADAGTPDASVILANGTEQELARFKLDSTKENFNVDELTFSITSGSQDDVEYLRLYDTNGNALSEGVSLDADREANFTGLTIEVPKTGDFVVVVKGMIKTIGERTTATDGSAGVGADSGTSVAVSTGTTANDFRAVGVSSGTVDNTADSDSGNTMVIRKSVPTIAILDLPITVLSNGTNTVAKFTITADENGDIAFKGLKPSYTLNNAGGSATLALADLKLYDVTGGNETELTATGVATTAFLPSDTPKVIAAGESKTFEIRGTVSNMETSDSISVSFTKDSAALSDTTETAANAIIDSNNDFVWSDQSADTNAATSVEYTNSFVLPTWDSSVFTLSQNN
ncbi:hypothetical protein EOL94_02015 [bacterium]|nr:hypothetical protein [bacterium]